MTPSSVQHLNIATIMGDGNSYTWKNLSKSRQTRIDVYHKGVIETNTFTKGCGVTWPVHWPVKMVLWLDGGGDRIFFVCLLMITAAAAAEVTTEAAATKHKMSHGRFNKNYGLCSYPMSTFNGNACNFCKKLHFLEIFTLRKKNCNWNS